ncbi:MAG TPA: tetratricopeptide repeat protein, partial [Candidatus Dormibacteraeota bacterium]|nr:tetratricopeptide repeat protein [Candidatus Dormibacteraeota bacterium]
VEFALYQMVRAGLAATNFPAATTALGKILAWYPNGFHTERAVLLAGQTVGQEGNPVEARRIYSEFIKAAPDAPLRPELELAMARTYEQEGAWTNALDLYETWLGAHTNSEACAQAEYCHALALAHSGEPTNALVSLTNFVARFPTNELTPLAQWWVADFFFKNGAYTRAENDYQVLATTWPGTQLAYEARMMAGRSAVAHYGWGDAAKYYFVPLWNDTNCPVHLRFQALYALGDTLVSQDSTNKLADFQEAFSAFDKICQLYSTNELAVLACGAKANCLLQWALSSAQVTNTITNASLAFEQVLTNAQASVAARSTAKVGLGLVLEKEAAQKPATEQLALRQQALDEYLDVFYKKILRPGEEPDLFWMKKACLEAGRLASELGHWSEARSVYERLGELLPELRSSLQERIRKAQEKENVARTGN